MHFSTRHPSVFEWVGLHRAPPAQAPRACGRARLNGTRMAWADVDDGGQIGRRGELLETEERRCVLAKKSGLI